MDIVEWLRDYYHMDSTRYTNTQIADEIEKLRKEKDLAWSRVTEANTDVVKKTTDILELKIKIERLQESLKKIAAYPETAATPDIAVHNCYNFVRTARSALKESE